jgi:hypothetical protein
MHNPEKTPNPDLPNGINPDFINFLNEKMQENKAFEDLIAANYAAEEVPVAPTDQDPELERRKKSLGRKIGESVFVGLTLYTTAGQGYENATQPAYEYIAPVTSEASADYAAGDITADHDKEERKTHPIEMPQEDLFDITKPVELVPAQPRNNHLGRDWIKAKKRKTLPKSLRRAIGH